MTKIAYCGAVLVLAALMAWMGVPAVATNLPSLVPLYNTGNVSTQPHTCGLYVKAHITSATDTQILAADGSKDIYICDFEFSATAGLNFYFEKSSTGTCGSPTQIGIVWTLATNEAKGAANAFYRGFHTGTSQQLCVNTSAGNIDIGVYYDQY